MTDKRILDRNFMVELVRKNTAVENQIERVQANIPEKPIDYNSAMWLPLNFPLLRVCYPTMNRGYTGGSAKVLDFHPDANHLTSSGGTFSVLGTPPFINYYNGGGAANLYVGINTQNVASNWFSIGCWCRLTEGASHHGLINWGNTLSSVSIIYYNGGYLEFIMYETGGTVRVLARNFNINLNEWMFVGALFGWTSSVSNTSVLQINDTVVTNNNQTINTVARTPTGVVEIGRNTAVGYWAGDIASYYLGSSTNELMLYYQATKKYFR